MRGTLHVTLRFLGDSTDEQIELLRPLVAELATVASASSRRIVAPAVSGFPAASRAHVLITETIDDGTLAMLAARAEEAAIALGFAPETRAYHAHLTLARMRKAVDVTTFAAEAASLPPARVVAVTLYASRTAPGGAVYEPLERVTLE